jgi:small-conductance mechanosensitive channel
VLYQTSTAQLRMIPGIVREIVEAQPQARFDRCHFVKYGDSSLNFETVFYVTTPDHTMYLNIQQEINLQLFQRFQAEGIGFAYPTRTIFVENGGGGSGGGDAGGAGRGAPAVGAITGG